MEKVSFKTDDQEEQVDFFVLEKTKINGSSYILVAESQEDDGECMILKGINEGTLEDDEEEIYEIVEDDTELLAVSKVFEELLEGVDIEL